MNRWTAEAAGHRVLVIGVGVTGLTTALCLRREGFAVTVVAEKFAPDIVSVVAGAGHRGLHAAGRFLLPGADVPARARAGEDERAQGQRPGVRARRPAHRR